MPQSLILLAGVVTLGVVLTAQPTSSPRDVRERAWQANNLGVAYLEQFNYAKAATQFEAALTIDAAFVPARVNLAIARMYEPDLPAAVKAATAAAEASSAPPHATFVLGLIARSENREEDALAAFRRVLQADPDDVASLVNLGQLLLQRRAYAEAVPVFGKAVELEPYNVSALYNLAVAQTRAGQRELGAATTAKFQVLRETGYGTTYSNTYMEQGRYAEAILSTGAEADVAPTPTALTYATAGLAFGSGTSSTVIAAGDLDHDGHSDYLVVTDAGFDAYVNTGAAPRRLRSASWPLPAAFAPRGAIVADTDNDGKADVLLHGRGGIALWRQKAGASGTAIDFEDVTARTGIMTALDVRTAALVDLDHDGDTDLVIGGANRIDGSPAPSPPGATTATAPLPTSPRTRSRRRNRWWPWPSSQPTWTCAATSTCSCSARTAASVCGATCGTPRSARYRPLWDSTRCRRRRRSPSATRPRTASRTSR